MENLRPHPSGVHRDGCRNLSKGESGGLREQTVSSVRLSFVASVITCQFLKICFHAIKQPHVHGVVATIKIQ